MVSEADPVWADCTDLLRPKTERAFLYRVRDADGVVIYVGMTRDEPILRFRSHIATASWWDSAVTVEVCTVPSQDARAMEQVEIHCTHPEGNNQCGYCRKNYNERPVFIRRRSVPRENAGIAINPKALRDTRIRRMLSRLELAEKVKAECQDILPRGITVDALGKYERGERRMKPVVLRALVMILACDPESLILPS